MSQKYYYIICFCSILIPLSLYSVLSLYLRTWIIDDAGISFVYSRSLANGHGLVPQPGAERVEGYSNFLWVLLYTPFFLFGDFNPIITPKVVSTILVCILFIYILKICILLKKLPIHALVISSLIAINTPFIIWTCSGLENPLYVLLIIGLVYLSIKYQLQQKHRAVVWAAVIAFLICITRPDGILFTIIFPIVILTNNQKLSIVVRPLLTYAGLTLFLLSILLAFRWLYFNDLVPNTYYAKEASTVVIIQNLLLEPNTLITKFNSIFLSMGGIDFIYIIYGIVALGIIQWTILRKKIKLNYILFSAWLVSLLNYILMPYDWMGNFRFATPFIVISHLYFFLMAQGILATISKYKKLAMTILIILLGVYAIISFKDHHHRLIKYSKYPAAPFLLVKKLFADGFNDYASELEITNGSILLPDVGATYYYSNLRVYDSAGLCNKTIAKGKYLHDRKLIQNYIFLEIKPTFIHLQDGWAEMIRPDEYPHFREEYITIYESLSEDYSRKHEAQIYSGDYVRKDAINPNNELALEKIIKKRNP